MTPLERRRVVVDATTISAIPSGSRTRLVNLYRAYAALQERPMLTMFTSRHSDLAEVFSDCVLDVVELNAETRWERVFSHGSRWRRLVDESRGDLLQVENVPVPLGSKVPMVLSLHDLRAFDDWRETLTLSGMYVRLLLPRAIRQVNAVVTLSDYGSRTVAERLRIPAGRIRKVSAAADPSPPLDELDRAAADLRRKHAVHRPFVLCLGHLERRKNLGVVIEAVCQHNTSAETQLDIVFVGLDKGEGTMLRRAATSAGVRAHFLGQVPDRERWAALRAASTLAIPSLVEGFGLAPLEAMQVGCPVVASNASALPEVVGDAGILVAPGDAAALARAIGSASVAGAERSALVTRGSRQVDAFSWDDAARTLRDLHSELLN